MKTLKKISLVYVLQICAVLLIFGYQRPSSESKEALTNKVSPPGINQNSAGKTNRDISPIIYIGKSW